MKKERLSYTLSLLVATTLIVAPFWWAQLWMWWTDLTAPIAFLVLGLWLGLYLTMQLRKEQPQTSILAIWLPLLAMLALHTALLLTWQRPATRAQGAALLGQQRLSAPLKACLHDDDAATIEACCQGLEALGHSPQERYARWLERHPEQGSLCMVRAINGKSLVANSFARSLATRWENMLLLEDAPDKQASDKLCASATYLRMLDRVPNTFVGPTLLRCTLSAPSHAAKYCCGQQLIQLHPNPGQDLPPAQELSATAFQQALPSLLYATLPHPESADPNPGKEALDQLAISGPALQHWALSATCHALPQAPPKLRDQIHTRLKVGLHATKGCALNQDMLLSSDEATWQSTCARWLEMAQAPDPAAALCDALTQELKGNALYKASTQLHLAQHRAYSPYWSPPDPVIRAILAKSKRAPGLKAHDLSSAQDHRAQTRDLLERMFRNNSNIDIQKLNQHNGIKIQAPSFFPKNL